MINGHVCSSDINMILISHFLFATRFEKNRLLNYASTVCVCSAVWLWFMHLEHSPSTAHRCGIFCLAKSWWTPDHHQRMVLKLTD